MIREIMCLWLVKFIANIQVNAIKWHQPLWIWFYACTFAYVIFVWCVCCVRMCLLTFPSNESERLDESDTKILGFPTEISIFVCIARCPQHWCSPYMYILKLINFSLKNKIWKKKRHIILCVFSQVDIVVWQVIYQLATSVR